MAALLALFFSFSRPALLPPVSPFFRRPPPSRFPKYETCTHTDVGGWIRVEAAAINENRAGRQTNHLLSIIAKVTFFSLQHPGGGIKNMEIPWLWM